MSRIKKNSKLIESAQQRLAALKSIAVDLDLGNGISVASYQAKIDSTTEALQSYNMTLSLVDERKHGFETMEDELGDLHERVLLSVASRYGKNSIEYEKAGGTRKSERRRAARRNPPPAA